MGETVSAKLGSVANNLKQIFFSHYAETHSGFSFVIESSDPKREEDG